MPASHINKSNNFIGSEMANDWFTTEMSLYHCEFDKDQYNDQLFNNFAVTFPESLQNAVVKRRAEFLAGRYCAKKSLQQFGLADSQLAVGKHRNPLWPPQIIGSISHCGSHAVAITGSRDIALGVGIDIEDEIASSTVEKIQQQILNQDETALISQAGVEKPLLFTLAFSVKESFFKAAYPSVGKYFDFDAVSLIAIDRDTCSLSLRINNTLHEKLREGDLINGHFKILPGKKIVSLIILHHQT